MTDEQKNLLELIKYALWGESYPDESRIFSDEVNWDVVLSEAYDQAVAGLVTGGIPENVKNSMPEKVRTCVRNARFRQVANFTKYLYHQSNLVELFHDAGIPIVILKGTSAAVYYPDPALRMMGDIDFLAPKDQFDTAKQLLLDNGYIEEKLKTPNPRHTGFNKDGVRFELHHHFSYDWVDIESYLTDGIMHAEIREINGHEFPMLPPLANGLVLLAHAGEHLRSGLGLRQVIDWMMYVDKNLDDQFWEESFRHAASLHGLETLAVTMTALCKKYLGLKKDITWCDGADEELVDTLMESLLDSGNFGRKQGAGNKIESIIVSFRREGIFYRLQDSGKANWKALKKHPRLTPFAWLYQIFRYIHQGLTSGAHITDSAKKGSERARLLRDLGLK